MPASLLSLSVSLSATSKLLKPWQNCQKPSASHMKNVPLKKRQINDPNASYLMPVKTRTLPNPIADSALFSFNFQSPYLDTHIIIRTLLDLEFTLGSLVREMAQKTNVEIVVLMGGENENGETRKYL